MIPEGAAVKRTEDGCYMISLNLYGFGVKMVRVARCKISALYFLLH